MTTDAQPKYANVQQALSAVQVELKNPDKTRQADTGKYKYKYADIGDILDYVRPILARHGIALTQPTVIRENSIVLETVLSYGESSIRSEYPVCSLNGNHQAMGAAMTYARRYALTSLIGIAAVDDTDGEGAAPVGEGPRVKMTANQAKQEVNWAEIQSSIDNAKDFKALDAMDARIEDRRNVWPDTYYWKAKERVEANRLDMAGALMASAKDIDSLNDEFARLEVILDKKVQWDDLASIHRKNETRLMNADVSNSPLMAG